MITKANNKFDIIEKIKNMFGITGEYKTEEDIANHISLSDKQEELVAIKLLVDKCLHNKYFVLNMDNYRLCKEEAKRLFN